MPTSRKRRRLVDTYSFPGFRPLATVQGVFGDPKARLITLVRRTKKRSVVTADWSIERGTTERSGGCEICPPPTCGFAWSWRSGAFSAAAVAP
jgi:hypothetical protein